MHAQTKAVLFYTECTKKTFGSSNIVVYVLFQGQSGNNLSLAGHWYPPLGRMTKVQIRAATRGQRSDNRGGV